MQSLWICRRGTCQSHSSCHVPINQWRFQCSCHSVSCRCRAGGYCPLEWTPCRRTEEYLVGCSRRRQPTAEARQVESALQPLSEWTSWIKFCNLNSFHYIVVDNGIKLECDRWMAARWCQHSPFSKSIIFPSVWKRFTSHASPETLVDSTQAFKERYQASPIQESSCLLLSIPGLSQRSSMVAWSHLFFAYHTAPVRTYFLQALRPWVL